LPVQNIVQPGYCSNYVPNNVFNPNYTECLAIDQNNVTVPVGSFPIDIASYNILRAGCCPRCKKSLTRNAPSIDAYMCDMCKKQWYRYSGTMYEISV
jgi:hypothetical protein